MKVERYSIKVYKPPKEWIQFAKEKNIKKIYFVDDKKIKRSLRFDGAIYFNIGKHNWKNYCIAGARTFPEAMTTKFLHQIAHIILGHRYISLRFSLDDAEKDVLKSIRNGNLSNLINDEFEREAWEFVLNFKISQMQEYQKLCQALQEWLKNKK